MGRDTNPGYDPPGNGQHSSGRVTPHGGTPPFDPTDPEALAAAVAYTAETLRQVGEDAAGAVGLAGKVARHAEQLEGWHEGMRDTVVRIETKVDELGTRFEAVETCLLKELGPMRNEQTAQGARLSKLDKRVGVIAVTGVLAPQLALEQLSGPHPEYVAYAAAALALVAVASQAITVGAQKFKAWRLKK